MGKRTTHVKAHIRDGKAVAAHQRTVTETSAAETPNRRASQRGVHALSVDETEWDVEEKNVWVNETPWNPLEQVTVRRLSDPTTGAPVRLTAANGEETVELDAGVPAEKSPVVEHRFLFNGLNYSGMDLRGYLFSQQRGTDLNFSGALLDGASFYMRRRTGSGHLRTGILLIGCSFDGASLRDVDMRLATLRKCSFVGADVTGADFSDVEIVGEVDFTNSTLTAEQYDALRSTGGKIIYRKHSVASAASALGVTEDDVAVMIWAGDLEARDVTGRVVHEQFDAERHHIPQWALSRHLKN